MASNAKKADLTQGTIWKQLVLFAIPIMMGQLLTTLYHTVDSIIVGKFVGKDALAAVGSIGPATTLIINLVSGFATGSSVIFSQYWGAKAFDRVRKTADTIYGLTLLLAAVFTGVCLFLVEPVLNIMNIPEEIRALSRIYLQVYFYGIPFNVIVNMGSALLRATGNSQYPMYCTLAAAVTNVVLDLLFVAVYRWGVPGAAYATLISQAIATLFIVIALLRAEDFWRLELRRISLSWEILRRVLRVGLPTGLNTSINTLGNLLVQTYINGFGSVCIASWSIYQQIDHYACLFVVSLHMALATFAGQNLGAGNTDRIRKGLRTSVGMSLLVSCSIQAVLMLLAPQITRIFNTDPTVITYTCWMLWLVGPIQVLACPNLCFVGTLRGVGLTKAPVLIALGSNVVVKILYCGIVTALSDSFALLIAGFPMVWALNCICIMIYYRFSHWEEKSLKFFREKAAG